MTVYSAEFLKGAVSMANDRVEAAISTTKAALSEDPLGYGRPNDVQMMEYVIQNIANSPASTWVNQKTGKVLSGPPWILQFEVADEGGRDWLLSIAKASERIMRKELEARTAASGMVY